LLIGVCGEFEIATCSDMISSPEFI
jgi:hypothetical protein